MRRDTAPVPWLGLHEDLAKQDWNLLLDANIEYDPRTGIAYTCPEGSPWVEFEELDWLGLGPDGEHSK